MKAATTGATSIIAQRAALAALTGPQDALNEMREAYARRRRLVLDALNSMGISYGVPQGGQFVFADISITGMKSVELAQRILTEQHVLAYPGGPFAGDWELGDNYLRITFLQPEEKLREGLERLKLTQWFRAVLCRPARQNAAREKVEAIRTHFMKIPQEAIIAGDTEADIECGTQLGFITVGILSGIRDRERLQSLECEHLLDNITGLPKLASAYQEVASEKK